MAAQPVTPQRVRDILSSFLYETEKRTPKTSPEKLHESPKDKETRGTPAPNVISSEKASNRRSFASFLKRVETFSPITWFAKPAELSPLVCSRFGWENTEFDMLHCTACGANLCGVLHSKADAKAYQEACLALEKKLLTSHEKFCTLAVNPCPESYLKISLHEVEELRKKFQQRIDALKPSSHLLPELVYTSLEIWGFAESHAAKFCAEEELSDTPTQIVTLAFTGWTLCEMNHQILICSMCRRQIGLWNFTPAGARTVANSNKNGKDKDVDDAGDSGPPPKMRKIEPQAQMDPISSHYAWCPWTALRVPSEDAMTLLPTSPPDTAPSSPSSASPPSPSSPSPNTSVTSVDGEGSGGSPHGKVGSGGDVGKMVMSQKQPAWVLGVRLVAPGLLSQSRRLVQQVKQSSIVEGLHCIRKVLKAWSSPDNPKTSCTSSPS